MSHTIRQAERRDLAAWLGMRQALWPDGPEGKHRSEIERNFAGRSREPLAVLVAEQAVDGVLGFAELSIRSRAEDCTTDRVGYLEGWYVIPQARRRGVGRALVVAAEQWARDQGCLEFGSDARQENEISAAAHLALGFADAGTLRFFRKDL